MIPKGSRWNPLHIPYQLYKGGNPDKAIELIEDLSVNVYKATTTGGAKTHSGKRVPLDTFWFNTCSFEDAKPRKLTNSINVMSTTGSEPLGTDNILMVFCNERSKLSSIY